MYLTFLLGDELPALYIAGFMCIRDVWHGVKTRAYIYLYQIQVIITRNSVRRMNVFLISKG